MTSHRPLRRVVVGGLLLLAIVLLPSCRRFTKEFADEQVYGILDAKRDCVPELVGSLNIEAHADLEEAARARKAYVLDADSAVGLAMVVSRQFRTQRETVYLTALDLTLARREFDPIWDAGADGAISVDEDGSTGAAGIDAIVSKAFATGGSIVFGLASDFLRGLTTTNPAEFAQSILVADMVIPLLRDAGRLVTLENLRQSERDTLYALRDFARFQQELRVDISSTIYRAIELEQRFENEERAYQSLLRLVDEQTFRAQAGDIAEFLVDQARTNLLEADDRRQRARRAFDDAVDALKLDLGIPMDVEIVLDRDDLMSILDVGPQEAPYPIVEALGIARERRLDLKNALGREVDEKRQILVARNALCAQLDILAGGTVDTPRNRIFDFEQAEARGDIGFILELPLERTAERNTYVRQIISSYRATRDRERTEDDVDRQVRTAFRRLEQTRRSYEIQVENLRLAERRVESTDLLLLQGTASIRDRLESEDARLVASNALTSAIVEYAIARLAYERDIGTLVVYEPPEELPPGPENGFPEPVSVEGDPD